MSKVINLALASAGLLVVEVGSVEVIEALTESFDCFKNPQKPKECILDVGDLDDDELFASFCKIIGVDVEDCKQSADVKALYIAGHVLFFAN